MILHVDCDVNTEGQSGNKEEYVAGGTLVIMHVTENPSGITHYSHSHTDKPTMVGLSADALFS